jgi:adenylate cyclase
VKKAKEILGLKAENLQSELDKARVKRTRNIYLFSGVSVAVFSLGLWNTLRRTRKSRAAIQQEKEVSEGLLHNILPKEVAAEIKAKGYADVRDFPNATVLFTDFKGFTALSEKLASAELVAEIDHCFKAFDGIMGKYSIEKIKTIGDAYMAAGGLPDPVKGHPVEVVRAALEMQAFMRSYKAERMAAGRLFFEMRLGIHTGPVIAGIVGVKKYAYDIWGDTVNTASRMESSGEVGKVNISAVTYELVKNETDLAFVPRGMVQAKGKGEMTMYFVEAA